MNFLCCVCIYDVYRVCQRFTMKILFFFPLKLNRTNHYAMRVIIFILFLYIFQNKNTRFEIVLWPQSHRSSRRTYIYTLRSPLQTIPYGTLWSRIVTWANNETLMVHRFLMYMLITTNTYIGWLRLWL